MHARKHFALAAVLAAILGPAASVLPGVAAPAAAQVVPQRLMEAMGAPEVSTRAVPVELSATLSHGDDLGDDVRWTVFERASDEVGRVMIDERGGTVRTDLPPGEYVAHIEFAGTSSVRPFTITEDGGARIFTLKIGAVSLTASSNGAPLAATDAVEFAIYDTGGEREVIRRGIEPGDPVVLPAGVYRAVVRYGDHNALAGADIRVRPGEVTHATLGVSGAPVRMSLVREAGATAALAAVAWRLFDDGGKPIMDSDEPSPALVLAPGSYTAEALHDGWTAVHRFEVVSGEPLDLKVPATE